MELMTRLITCLLFFSLKSQGQGIIYLSNPSFEDEPKCCEAPTGWHDCGLEEESPPDIQPGSFEVNQTPAHGDTYLGLVVRDNNTCEAVGQRLPESLQYDQSYVLRVSLARSELYLSLSRSTGEEVNYATPVKLQIWGGIEYCDKRELLAESPLITHTEWQEYELNFTPRNGHYNFITLEAQYKTPVLFPYNGNLLIDNLVLTYLDKK